MYFGGAGSLLLRRLSVVASRAYALTQGALIEVLLLLQRTGSRVYGLQ